MAQDRRHHRRYRVADLSGTLQFSHPARVIDLSRSGAAIETSERLAPGRTYSLQLGEVESGVTSTTARVIWCKLTGTRESSDGDSIPIYRAGLEFEGVLAEPASLLLDQLDDDGLAGVDTRLQARYKMSDLASTLLLRDRAGFEVRSLSRAGMGAEMEYSPRVGSMLEFVLPLDEPVEIKGRVADVVPAEEDPRRFLVGIEFVGLGSVAQIQLDRYIARLRTSPVATHSE
jgi:hypothetical protein